MGFEDFCNTGLVLGLGFSSTVETKSTSGIQRSQQDTRDFVPSLTLGICSGQEIDGHDQLMLCHQDSGTSSFSNASVKREREVGSEEGEMEEDDDGTNIARKKLKLSKDQSAVLEENFKLHTTLNPKQKQELARKLNLRPRQVEVWFQNRRARTKLKQTEVDCEYLKTCCENLRDENRRLQKELQELRALKLSQPYYMQLPAATLSMCPSCERISSADHTTDGQLSVATSKGHFFSPFANPSAAC